MVDKVDPRCHRLKPPNDILASLICAYVAISLSRKSCVQSCLENAPVVWELNLGLDAWLGRSKNIQYTVGGVCHSAF